MVESVDSEGNVQISSRKVNSKIPAYTIAHTGSSIYFGPLRKLVLQKVKGQLGMKENVAKDDFLFLFSIFRTQARY